MILILTCRPLRRRNVAAMVLGQHLVRQGYQYVLKFDEDETKNRRPFEQPLAPQLSPIIDRYLEHYRPKLLGAETSEHVWISWRGKPLTDCVIYASLVARTREAFGFAVPPHRFRDSVVTSLCEDHPDQIWLAATLLHHADHCTAEKHYNQAQDMSAVRSWQEHVATHRKAARRGRRRSVSKDRKCRPHGSESNLLNWSPDPDE
jgi:integrase/recombinase XerD